MLGFGVVLAGTGLAATEGAEVPEGVPGLTELPFDGYVFDAGQNSSVSVPLSGTGDANRDLEVRAASAGRSTAWTPVTADANGDWSVVLEMDQSTWSRWHTPQARYGAGGQVAQGTASFGCGTVLGFLGQSELTYFHALGDTYNPLPYPPLSDENLTVLLQADDTGFVTSTRVTTADKTTVNMGLVAMANALYHAGAARKFMVIDLNQPGTSRGELMDDSDTERQFSHLTDLLAVVRSGGSDVGLVVENWYNADAAAIPNIGPIFAPWYFGQRWNGETFALGSTNPDNGIEPTLTYDHCLWDIEAPADQLGRGVFARDRTKLAMVGPMPFHDTPEEPASEWENYTGAGTRLIEPARAVIDAFTTDPRVQTFCVGYGPSTHLCNFDGSIHPAPSDPYGSAQFALSHTPPVLNWIGQSVGEPSIEAIEVATDGTFADVVIDLPNGGVLTTLRIMDALPDPQVEPPHYQEVVGFEITRAGGQRRPVFKLSATEYPSAHRGTVTIADQGSGEPRKAKLRITPEEPFGTGDQISYLLGQAAANLLKPRDVDAQLHLNMLLENVPTLYDATSDHPLRGIPVKPHAETPAIILPSTFQARAAHFDGATNYASASINQPAGNSGLMSFWFRNRDSAWNAKTSTRICQFRVASQIVLEIRVTSSGRMTFQLNQTGSGDDTFTPPADTFALNKWHHVAWSWDQVAARFQLCVDGFMLDTGAYDWGDGDVQMAGANLTRIGIGGNVSTANQVIGDIGHFWLDLNQSMDLSDPANLSKFLSNDLPVDLGATGELPLGSTPHYYYDGDGPAWTNLGTGGNVPINGALSASDTSPAL